MEQKIEAATTVLHDQLEAAQSSVRAKRYPWGEES